MGYPGLCQERAGARPRLHPAFKGRRSYAKLFLEGGREMAGVGIAQIGRHRHDGGIAVGQRLLASCIRSA